MSDQTERARDPEGRFAAAGGGEAGRIAVHPLRDTVLPGRKAAVVRGDRQAPPGVLEGSVAESVARLPVLPDEPGDVQPDEGDPWKGAMPHRVAQALGEYNHALMRRGAKDMSWAAPPGQSTVRRAWSEYRRVALEEAAERGLEIDIPATPPEEDEG